MRKYYLCLVLLVFTLILTSCGTNYSEGDMGDYAYRSSLKENSVDVNEEVSATTKLVYEASVSLETKEYDTFFKNFHSLLDTYGAYCSSEKLNGSSSQSRYASITIRVPVEHYVEFMNSLTTRDDASVISQSSTVTDISLSYASLKARSETLAEQITAMEKILESATTISEIQSLSDDIYCLKSEKNEIDKKLAVLDNQVAYSTIELSVQEVKVYTEPEKEGAFARIWSALKNNFSDIGNGIVELFVFFTGATPYFLLFGVIGLIVFGIVWLSTSGKRKRKKAQQNTEAEKKV